MKKSFLLLKIWYVVRKAIDIYVQKLLIDISSKNVEFLTCFFSYEPIVQGMTGKVCRV